MANIPKDVKKPVGIQDYEHVKLCNVDVKFLDYEKMSKKEKSIIQASDKDKYEKDIMSLDLKDEVTLSVKDMDEKTWERFEKMREALNNKEKKTADFNKEKQDNEQEIS